MPRPLVFSNGSLFVGIDGRYRIRDLFYPHVGLYNHLSGNAIRLGVWTGGRFAWVGDDGWDRRLGYDSAGLIGDSSLRNDFLGVDLAIREWVEPDRAAFHREIRVRDVSGAAREVRLYFAHDLQIAETDIGDTALFQPFLGGIVHYKGPHYFLFTANWNGKGIDEYACGTVGFGGLEGTWRDAEDGHLSMNPISQGSVDSAMGVRFDLPAGGTETVRYRIAAADSMAGLEAFDREPAPSSRPREETDRTAQAVLDGRLAGLPESVVQVARRSLLLVEAMCDQGGAVLAATDSDIMETARANYCYTWPRDAAHICRILTRLGRLEPVERFFRFVKPLVSEQQPFLLQKYRPDGTLGATWHPWVANGAPEVPHQEDESASTLAAAAEYAAAAGNEILEEFYEALLWPLARHLADFRDPATGLPLPSYDLWEERRGVHAYTCAAVYEGLNAATSLAESLGRPEAERFRAAAQEVRAAVHEHMRGPHGNFARRLEMGPNGAANADDAPDASTLWLGLSGLIDPKDPLFEIHMRAIWDALWVEGPVGGMARYRDDYYFRASQDVAGNPWIITTLWLAQCLILRAETEGDLTEPLEMLVWAAHYAGPTGVLPEQLHPLTGEPLSVSPLTWSHAEFLKTALDWAERRASLAG